MEENNYPDNNKEQIVKAKKNLVYLLMFSVTMMFAGFSSAYIVSMGDSFWLKVPLPPAFWVSTVVIGISSISMIIAVMMAKKGNTVGQKVFVTLTLLLGISFAYFQFKGYGQLMDNGIHAANNHIIVTDGKYGDYFEIKKGDDYIEVNGNDYLLKGKKLSGAALKELQDFVRPLNVYELKAPFGLQNYGKPYTILFKSEPLTYNGKELIQPSGEPLPLLDKDRLFFLARNICDGRGDFFVRGEMGKDFHVYYKGKELQYENRELQLNGRKLEGYLQLKAMESADTASSYLYIISFLHLLHVIITVLFVLSVVIRSFTGVITKDNSIQLETTAIFWHFLGALWLYLLLFLLFIH